MLLQVILGLIGTVIILACLYYYKRKKEIFLKLQQLRLDFNTLISINANEKLSIELRNSLQQPLNDLSNYMNRQDKIIHRNLSLTFLDQIYEEEVKYLKTKQDEIMVIQNLWVEYIAYKKEVMKLLAELGYKEAQIKKKCRDITDQHEEFKENIKEKTEDIIDSLRVYQEDLRVCWTIRFAEFTSKMSLGSFSQMILEADDLLKELQYFSTFLQVKIVGLVRKSKYYLTLLDSREERYRQRIGDTEVSYKSFQEAKKGNRYKEGIVIGDKHVSSQQSTIFQITKGKREYRIERRLDNNQFETIFKTLPCNRKYEEADAQGVPYQFDDSNLEILVCQKNPLDFAVLYEYKPLEEISIYSFLSFNIPGLGVTKSIVEAEKELQEEESKMPEEVPEKIAEEVAEKASAEVTGSDNAAESAGV